MSNRTRRRAHPTETRGNRRSGVRTLVPGPGAALALAAAGTLIGVAVGVSTAHAAAAPPTKAQYCSRTGDGRITLHLIRNRVVVEARAAELYQPRSRVCLKPPGNDWVCRTRPVVPLDGGPWISRFALPARPGLWGAAWAADGRTPHHAQVTLRVSARR